jgi:orotidine-5'-phosphate decarboxylase
MERFSDRLAAAIDRCGTPACVGLDPVYERLPAPVRGGEPHGAIMRFCMGVVAELADGPKPIVPVLKPQIACFERYGPPGLMALAGVIEQARRAGFLVLLDAKRGDIGATAEHYAAATLGRDPAHALTQLGADAVTLSGYMGPDTVEPFLKVESAGVFVLVRTSNPGSDAVQAQRLADGRTVAEMMADMVAGLGAGRKGTCGLSDVGAVVGATKSAEAAALRARMPDQVFLIPGYGAQGGTVDDIRPCVRPGAERGRPSTMGVLVNASRSVLYPEGAGTDWRKAVRGAAERFVGELRGLEG